MKHTTATKIGNCAAELQGISTTLHTIGYSIVDGTRNSTLTAQGIDQILFTLCNHIDRVAADLDAIEQEAPQA